MTVHFLPSSYCPPDIHGESSPFSSYFSASRPFPTNGAANWRFSNWNGGCIGPDSAGGESRVHQRRRSVEDYRVHTGEYLMIFLCLVIDKIMPAHYRYGTRSIIIDTLMVSHWHGSCVGPASTEFTNEGGVLFSPPVSLDSVLSSPQFSGSLVVALTVLSVDKHALNISRRTHLAKVCRSNTDSNVPKATPAHTIIVLFCVCVPYSQVLTVAAVPVAMMTVLSVTMAMGAHNMAKKSVVVTKVTAVEELAGVDVLCSDKTGQSPIHKVYDLYISMLFKSLWHAMLTR